MTTEPPDQHPDDADASASPGPGSQPPTFPPPDRGDDPASTPTSPMVQPPGAEPPEGLEPPRPDDAAVAQVTPQAPDNGGSRRGRLVGGLVVVIALIAAGAFAITRIADSDESAGAGSPEELGEQVLDAVDNTDVLGIVNLLLPGERQTLGEPTIELVRELERLNVLSDVDLSGVQGVDVTVDDREVEVVETEVDDIVYIDVSGSTTAQVIPDELPAGGLIEDATTAASDVATEESGESGESEGQPFTVSLVGVERDGQWYLSVWYLLAEQIRMNSYDPESGETPPIPEEGVTASGGETPEAAITALTDALSEGDLETMIAAINPNEAEALQRYAPLFLDDAAEAFESSGAEFDFTEVEVRAEGSGDERQIYIEKVAADISVDIDESELPVGTDTTSIPEEVHVEYEDGCFIVEGATETVDTCELQEAGELSSDDLREMLEDQVGESDEMMEIIDTLVAAFEDFEAPGITVSQVDGEWYVSPMSTGWTWLFAITGALDADELEEIVDLGQQAADLVGPADIGD